MFNSSGLVIFAGSTSGICRCVTHRHWYAWFIPTMENKVPFSHRCAFAVGILTAHRLFWPMIHQSIPGDYLQLNPPRGFLSLLFLPGVTSLGLFSSCCACLSMLLFCWASYYAPLKKQNCPMKETLESLMLKAIDVHFSMPIFHLWAHLWPVSVTPSGKPLPLLPAFYAFALAGMFILIDKYQSLSFSIFMCVQCWPSSVDFWSCDWRSSARTGFNWTFLKCGNLSAHKWVLTSVLVLECS